MSAPAPSLARTLFGGLPPVFWTLWVGTLINRVGSFVVPFLTIYLVEKEHLSVASAGAVVSAYGAGCVLSSQLGGVLADRIGRKATMVLGLGATAVMMTVLGLVRGPWALGLATAGLGFVADLYRPGVAAAVSDIVPFADRLRAFGLLHWAVNIGFSIAPVVAGRLAEANWRLLFIGDAATTALYALLILVRVSETRPADAPRARFSPGDILAPLGDRRFAAFLGLSFLTAVIFQQHAVTLPVAMRADGISARSYGAIIAANGLLIVALQPFASRLLGGHRRARVLAMGALLAGGGFFANAFADGVGGYLLSVVVWTLGEIAGTPAASAFVADRAPAEQRGRYQGAYTTTWGLALVVGPSLGGWLFGRSPGALWTGCLVLGVVVAAGHLLLGRSGDGAPRA